MSIPGSITAGTSGGRDAGHEPSPSGRAADSTRSLGPEEIWREPLDKILARLSVTPAGLSGAEAQTRLAIHGPNDAAAVL